MNGDQLHELGGGLTVLGLLSILVHNFLVRKKEDAALNERLNLLHSQLDRIERQQNELLQMYTNLLEKSSMLIGQRGLPGD